MNIGKHWSKSDEEKDYVRCGLQNHSLIQKLVILLIEMDQPNKFVHILDLLTEN